MSMQGRNGDLQQRGPKDFNLRRMSDVKAEDVTWLWDKRIARGKLNILEGMPGTGKSQLTCEWAACVSRGAPLWGDAPGGRKPEMVMIVNGEDGTADTIKPRLVAAGADLSRVLVLDGVGPEEDQRPLTLPDDIPELEEQIADHAIAVLVLDPLSAFLSGEINTHRDADVRRVLTQLKSLAERTRAAVIVVRHLVKAPQGAAITAGGGSIGFIGAARTAHLAATDPDDPERFVLAVVKNNLAKKEPSIRYHIETSADGSPHPVFDEFTTHRADELVAAARERDDPNRLAIDDAVDFLREALSDTAGVPKKELLLRAKEQGITESTLGRAGTKLGVEQRRTGWPATTRWFYCQSPKSPQVDVTGAPSPPKLLSDNAPTVTSPGLTRLAPTSAMARLQNGDKNAVEEGEI